MNELILITIIGGCCCILVGGIAVKNGLEKFTDEIKTEIALLATKNNNDIQDISKRLRNVDIRGVDKLHVKIYVDDSPERKAEKLYEICETNAALINVLMQLEKLVERMEDN